VELAIYYLVLNFGRFWTSCFIFNISSDKIIPLNSYCKVFNQIEIFDNP
jgi:hypothetical protein